MDVNSPGPSPKLRLPASCDPPSDAHPSTPKTWLIFGATGHIGRSVVKAALTHGDRVAAVGRMMENTTEEMQGWHERCHGLLCDVRVRETVVSAVQACIARFGGVDVVVNCTGYGVIAACEDQDASDLRSQLDTNFWGTVNIIHATLPHLRERAAIRPAGTNAGRYLIFSSTSGALGVPGLGPYCATKYAVEGLIESMLYEIDAFDIKATLVEPGHVRLDEETEERQAAEASVVSPSAVEAGSLPLHRKRYGHFLVKPPSAPYATPTAPAGHARRVVQWLAGRQPTSAPRCAELVWQLGHCRFPPLRLLLGSFAVESVRDRLRSIIEEIEDWKHLNFPTSESANGSASKGKGREAMSALDGKGEDYAEGEEDEIMEAEDGVDVGAPDEGEEHAAGS